MSEEEQWRDFIGYEGLYSISNKGSVLSHWSGKKRRPKISNSGYYELPLSMESRQRNFFVHRMVAIAWVENPDGKPFVNHIDGNKLNNNSENLEWVTPLESIIHASKTGLMDGNRGSGSKFAKLNEALAMEIYKSVGFQRIVAKKYGVAPSLVGMIRNRKIWKHIHAT